MQSLEQLALLVQDRTSSDYDFKRATGSLAHDLKFVSDALSRDADVWRMNRAFHAVHVPSFLAIMSMLDDIDDMTWISEDERHQIYASINRASQLASTARQRIEHSMLAEAKAELSVLADYAPASDTEFTKASLFERTLDSLFTASDAALDKARESVEAVPNVVGALKEGLDTSIERASAVPLLASNLQRTLAGAFSDNVTKPVSNRLQAGSKALTRGAGAGVGLGVVAAVLFPPLVPVSAGAGILVAMRSWRKEMQKAQALNAQEREKRIAELQAERAAALQQLTNGSPSVQMETEDLSLTLDTETGEADALVLTGAYEGRMWSDLTAHEKAQAALNFAQAADAILRILEFGRESL